MTNHWERYHRHWRRLASPLRPDAQTVKTFETVLRVRGETVLLLGVTPELTALSRRMIAVEGSAAMIAGLWPGDDGTRRAVVGDWQALPIGEASVGRAVGDGCLTVVGSRAARLAVIGEIARVLHPDGLAAVRLFAGPELHEQLDSIREDALAGAIGNFHALKWRVAMACATPDADRLVAVRTILETIDRMFPDRDALSASTGWDRDSIDTVDVYRGSDVVYTFASEAMLVEEASLWFDDVSLVPTGDYPLAERCPLLVLRSPRRVKRKGRPRLAGRDRR